MFKHWSRGGETSLSNVALLGSRHHHLVHEGGFGCEKTGDGEVVFRDERKEPLAEWSVLLAIGDTDINEWLDRRFFEDGAGPDTCNAQWYAGERMDWNLAVSNLCQP